MTLLLGSEAAYSNESSLAAGFPEAYKFVASASGTLDTIRFTVSSVNPCLCTSLALGIYSDSSGPDALLGSDEAIGTPALGEVVEVTGLSVPIVSGTTYWLAFMALGGQVTYAYANTGGLVRDVDGGPFGSLQDPWTTDFADTFGPVNIAGYEAGGGGPITRGALVFQVTGLWTDAAVEAGAVTHYGTIFDGTEGKVEIPFNDSRLASIKVSAFDPIVEHLIGHTYARLLKVYYHGEMVFWGPVKLLEPDLDDGTVTINAVDPSLRLINHFLRRGDINGDLGADTDDRATVTIDHVGMRVLRDAGNNIDAQTARGVPNLGIEDGFNDFPAEPTDLMGVARGDQVWSTMIDLSQSNGPDFELQPIDAVVGFYCRLNTFNRQGTDRPTVQLHRHTGLNNLDGLKWTEGSKYITHVHTLDRNQTYRVTPANLETSAETGPYVLWDTTDWDAEGVPQADAERKLVDFGNDVLKAYSHPLIAISPVLPLETESTPRYLRDFEVADTIRVAGELGYAALEEAAYRIVKVTISQDGEGTRTELDVVSSVEVTLDSEED